MFRACNRSNIWVNRQYSTRDLAGTKHFFCKFVEKWINDVYETGVVSNIAVMQWSRSHYFCGSVQMSSRQSSSIFWRWFLLLCTMVNYWLNMIKPPFGGIFIRTFFQASKSRKPKSWFNGKWPICKTSSTFRSPTNEQTQHPKSCWLSQLSPPRTSTYNRDEGCSTAVPFLGCFPGDVLEGFFLRSPNLVKMDGILAKVRVDPKIYWYTSYILLFCKSVTVTF